MLIEFIPLFDQRNCATLTFDHHLKKNAMANTFFTLKFSVCLMVLGNVQIPVNKVDEPPVAEFSIVIETLPEELKLTCENGCAFKELTFTLKEGGTQRIDQNGMWVDRDTDPEFAFEITRTADGLAFKGIKGTTWTNLTSSCAPQPTCLQRIHQEGVKVYSKD